MKKLVGIILAVVGLLVAAAGVAGVVLIGSDNVMDSPATTLRIGDAKAVVSTPGLLAYEDTTMQVTAERSGGQVFIGRAHPIDAKNYLSGAPTFGLTRVDGSGVAGEPVKGDAGVSLTDPAKQTFWTDTATGSGKQSLDLELDGSPTQYVVIPLGEGGDVTMSSGVKIANAFALSIGAIVLGLLALVAGIVLMRRRRTSPTTADRADTLAEQDGARALHDDDSTHEPTESSKDSSRTAPRLVTGLAAAVLVPTLAGCGMVPTRVEAWKNDEITKTSLPTAEATAVIEDYETRNNTAIKKAAEKYDTDVWNGVDDGVLLSADVYETRYAQAKKDKSVASATMKVGPQVYSPAFKEYPMYALVSTQENWGEQTNDLLVAMARKKVTAPWVKVASAHVKPESLPKANQPGADSTLTTEDEKTAVAAMNTLKRAMDAGKGAGLSKEVTDHLATLRKKEQHVASSTLSISPWVPGESGQVSPSGSILSAKTENGQLALITYQIVWTRNASSGTRLHFTDRNYAKAVGQTGDYPTLVMRTAITLAVDIDAKGGTKVIGQSLHDLT